MQSFFLLPGAISYTLVIFLNAFTDLGHKIIIQNTIFKVYDEQTQIILTAIVNALILLPYMMVFTPSGFLADRFSKPRIMKYAASVAVLITLGITACYYAGWFLAAFALTFVMAAQSAFYATAKYGYIKELFGEAYISAGNALAQSVTTVAILGGIIAYSILFEARLEGMRADDEAAILTAIAPLGWLLVLGSVIEWLASMRLPYREAASPHKKLLWRKYIRGFYLHKNFTIMRRKPAVFHAIIALSFYWAIAQVVLAVFGAYAKTHLGQTNAVVVQGAMALAGVGIVIGSITAAGFSRHFIHMGMAPFGMVGMALMVFLLPIGGSMQVLSLLFFLFGWFAGFYLVPLNAYIQDRTPHVHLGTVLAGNNLVQNIFMVAFLALTTLFAYEGIPAVVLIWMMVVLCAAVAVWMVRSHLLMLLWFVARFVLAFRYKIVYEGVDNVPHTGAVLLLGNHTSWLDWLLVQFPIERRLRYIMQRRIYEWKIARWMFRLGRTIPVSSRSAKEALAEGRRELQHGGALTLFPEGGLSKDGEIAPFKRGFEIVADGVEGGVIVPFHIDGIYGSLFSPSPTHTGGRGLRRVITVRYGSAMPLNSRADRVQTAVTALKGKDAE